MSPFKPHRLITSMKPAQGGWRFPQPWNGGVIWREAGDAETLLKRVIEVRVENAMPMGDPAADIAAYIKSVSPNNDGGRRAAVFGNYEPTKAQPIVPMIEFLKAWLVGMIKRDFALVREDEADKRAQVCIGCPQNISWEVSCQPCNTDIEYRSDNLRQRPIYRFDKKLRACRLHRFPLQSGVFIDRQNLPPRHEKAPEQCWVGKEPTL